MTRDTPSRKCCPGNASGVIARNTKKGDIHLGFTEHKGVQTKTIEREK